MVTLSTPRRHRTQSGGKTPPRLQPGLRLRLLGTFRAELDGQPVHLPRRKVEHLLAYLVLQPGEHSREEIAALLWGDLPDEQARGSLRTALSVLRGQFGVDLLLTDRDTIQLNPKFPLWLDARELDRAARRLLDGVEVLPAAEASPEALSLYAGDLLPACYDDWVVPLREGFRERHLDLLLFLAQSFRAQSDYDRAADYARLVLVQDPVNERAHQHLMFCYLMMGNRALALEQYADCTKILRSELAAEPSPETTALFQWIKQAPGGKPSLAGRITNLPMPGSSFVGRKAEMREVKEKLGAARLVTLAGTGGCGKTRLAIQAATDLLDGFKDGVWWVELAPLTEPALVPEALARVLGLRESTDPSLSLTDLILRYFRARTALIVLDNCEHLIDACAQLTQALLESGSDLRVLATSREPLGLPGEQVYPVPALSLPTAGPDASLKTLAEAESLRLFTERAAVVSPGFALTPETAPLVVQICQRLDGMPLAIELAASRLGMMSLPQIASRLDDRFQLLSGGDRAGLPHHQTLRALMDWSFNLLSEQEKMLFRRLAVFSGGWTLEAAESICGADGIRREEVLDLIDRLVHKSLLEVNTCGETSRFRMHETVRQYALEKLHLAAPESDVPPDVRMENDETDALRDRHLAHFAALAEQGDAGLRGPDDLAWLERLDADHENLRSALGWAFLLLDVEPQSYLQLSGALRDFWFLRGHYSEGYRLLLAGLDNTPEVPIWERARALSGLSLMCSALGRGTESAEYIRSALGMARRLDAKDLILEALYHYVDASSAALDSPEDSRSYFAELLSLARTTGNRFYLIHALSWDGVSQPHDADEALGMLEEALRLARGLGNARALAYALAGMAALQRTRGSYNEARRCLLEWLDLSERLGDLHGKAYVLNRLGRLSNQEGDLGSGRQYAEESLQIYRDLSAEASSARPLYTLGWNAYLAGEMTRASKHLDECLAIRRSLGVKYFLTGPLVARGRAALGMGDHDGARTLLREALEVISSIANYHWLAPCLEAVSGLPGLAPMESGRLLGAAESVRERQAFVLPPSERLPRESLILRLQEQLPASALSAAWAEGKAMTVGQALQAACACLSLPAT
jgi:predicted ATPase/DNA-binding SARP family transcriptional activator